MHITSRMNKVVYTSDHDRREINGLQVTLIGREKRRCNYYDYLIYKIYHHNENHGINNCILKY